MVGEIAPTDYPGYYTDNYHCDWMLTIPDGADVWVVFTDMYVEETSSCSFDYVQVGSQSE